MQLCEAVRSRAAVDVAPPPGPAALFMRDQMSLEGYRHLLAVGESSAGCRTPVPYSTCWPWVGTALEGCRTVPSVPCADILTISAY